MTPDCRRLPFRIWPLPDEPFDSWFESMAYAYDVTAGEMAIALGLVSDVDHARKTGWLTARWTMKLTDEQAGQLEAATGIPSDEFHQMTRARFWQSGIRQARSGRLSSASPVAGNGGRFCPECLRDSVGRWRMSWQLPTGFACLRHQRLLSDTCPKCGMPPRHVGHPINAVPRPGACHNREPGSTARRVRCRGDLTSDEGRLPATGAVLEAQRTVFRILSAEQASFGIYAQLPQPSIAVLEDLRLLARLGREVARDRSGDVSDLDRTLLVRFMSQSSMDDSRKARPEQSINIAVGVTLAVQALSDRERTLELIRGRLSASKPYTAHSAQLQELIAAALGRRRRPTAVLQSAETPRGEPAERARKLPIMLWDAWARRLAPRRTDREIAATALSAAVVFVGTRLTHAAALSSLDPEAPSRRVTQVMRQLGRPSWENTTLVALIRLAAHIDQNAVPIDYGRRRKLDYRHLLELDTWERICADANVHPGGERRHTLARHYLFQRLTGSPLSNAPEPWQHGRSVTSAEVSDAVSGAPNAVRDALDNLALEFLAAVGIHEPMVWEPSRDLLSDLELPPAPTVEAAEWPTARPARAIATSAVPDMPESYRAGATTRELAGQAGVSRQTVQRVLEGANTTTRRGGRRTTIEVDREWLRKKYLYEKLAIAQIAALVGCSPSSISRRLRAAGLPTRGRGGGSTAAALHPHKLAGDSPLLRRTLIGRNSVERARRLLVVAGQPSLQDAAARIGTSPSSLSAQLTRLGADAGGPLFIAAARGRPAQLTPLGKQFVAELRMAISTDLDAGR